MVRFGGNEIEGACVPLVCLDRYFVVEPGPEALLSVLVLHGEELTPEILRNEPAENDLTDVHADPGGTLTVTEKLTERVLYRLTPGVEARIAFTKVGAGGAECKVTRTSIQVGGATVQNNTFGGRLVAVMLDPGGRIGIGAPLPPRVLQWIEGRREHG